MKLENAIRLSQDGSTQGDAMSTPARILDLAERAVRAAERIADALDRGERHAQKPAKKAVKTLRFNESTDIDRALANRAATRLGVYVGGKK